MIFLQSRAGNWLLAALLLLCACFADAQTPMAGSASITGFGEFDSGPGTIPSTLFGLHFSLTRGSFSGVGYTGIPWPNVSGTALSFGSLRLWDTNTNWMVLNPSSGVYAFSSLDSYLAAAKTNGLSDVLLTLSGTPSFISGDPTNTACDYGQTSGLVLYGLSPNYLNGSCGAPTDLNSDGTGTDATWRAFIYALATHIAGLNAGTYATVNWFEMWNEFTRGPSSGGCGGPNNPISWEGTCAQMVRMAQDANCILTGRGPITATSQTCTAANMGVAAVKILPTAGMLTPDAVPQQPDVTEFGSYLAGAGALQNVDRIAVHAYSFSGPGTTFPDSDAAFSNTGSSLPAQWNMLAGAMPAASFGIPVWSTEGSYAGASNLPDPDMMMGYIARYYLVGWSSGFRRLYWYAANNSWGRLVWQNGETETSTTSPYGAAGTCATTNGCPVLNSASVPVANAWTSVYGWMVGNEMTTGCGTDVTGNIWSCGLVISGTPALAVWDASQTCTNGTCTTSTYSYNAALYGHYQKLDDAPTLHALSGGTVTIGWKPILLVP